MGKDQYRGTCREVLVRSQVARGPCVVVSRDDRGAAVTLEVVRIGAQRGPAVSLREDQAARRTLQSKLSWLPRAHAGHGLVTVGPLLGYGTDVYRTVSAKPYKLRVVEAIAVLPNQYGAWDYPDDYTF